MREGWGIYRVQTVVRYLPGHPIYERAKKSHGEYWKDNSEANETKWDFVIAPGVEEACYSVRTRYEVPGVLVKRIYSLNHIGDVTVVHAD